MGSIGATRDARRAREGGAYVFHVAERVVDRNDVGAVLLARRAAHETTNAAEAGDAHLDHG
jgi:hypothetical protein